MTLCLHRLGYSTTAATANRNGLFSYYINYKFMRGHLGVRVRVMTRTSVGVMVRFYFAVVLVIFSQFYAFALLRCRMGTALRLGLGSGG